MAVTTRQSTTIGFGTVAKTYHPLYYSVKDYGAVGDGSTDDTTAVNAAITAAKTAGVKTTVFFPAGTYRVGLIDTCANMTNIDLVGPYTSGSPRPTSWTAQLKFKDGFSSQNMLNYHSNTNCSIRYLSFNGNSASASGYGMIYSEYCTGCIISGCQFIDSDIEAFEINPGDNWLIENCTSDSCAQTFIVMGDPDSHDITFRNNRVYNSPGSGVPGFYLQSGAYRVNVLYNEVEYCWDGVRLVGDCNDCLIHGNTFTNTKNGVYCASTGSNYNTYSYNTIVPGAFSTGNGIDIYEKRAFIIGNTISDWGGTWYPINIHPEADYVTCNYNTVSGSNVVNFEADHVIFNNNTIQTALANGTRFYTAAFTDVLVANNLFQNNQRAGFFFSNSTTATNVRLINNTALNNGQRVGYSNTYDGFQFGSAVTGLVLSGNHAHDTGDPQTQRRGITVFTGSTGTYDGTNDMTGNIGSPSWDGLTSI